jgi:hypothetical protein
VLEFETPSDDEDGYIPCGANGLWGSDMRRRRGVVIGIVLSILALAGCGTPLLPSVGLLSPYEGEIPAGVETGSWPLAIGVILDFFFAENAETVTACSPTGGPVSVTLDSYVDPLGVDTDISVSGATTQGLNGPGLDILIPAYDFTDVGDTVVSASLAPGECFRIGVRSPARCIEVEPPASPFEMSTCVKTAWPGITYTIEW